MLILEKDECNSDGAEEGCEDCDCGNGCDGCEGVVGEAMREVRVAEAGLGLASAVEDMEFVKLPTIRNDSVLLGGGCEVDPGLVSRLRCCS